MFRDINEHIYNYLSSELVFFLLTARWHVKNKLVPKIWNAGVKYLMTPRNTSFSSSILIALHWGRAHCLVHLSSKVWQDQNDAINLRLWPGIKATHQEDWFIYLSASQQHRASMLHASDQTWELSTYDDRVETTLLREWSLTSVPIGASFGLIYQHWRQWNHWTENTFDSLIWGSIKTEPEWERERESC